VKPATRQIVTIAGLGLFALIVAAAGFVLVIKPQRTKISTTNAKILAAQTQLDSLKQGPAKAPAIRASDLFSLTRAMPEIDDMPGVVVDLSQIAKSTRMQLVGIRPASRVALADGSSAVPMTVTLNGNWKGLSAFLRTMRRRVSLVAGKPVVGGRIYNVDNVQITSGTKPFELQAVLTMNAFDYGAPPSPTATAGVTGASGATTGTTTTTTTTPATGSGG
jgi:Tfp pilus assembly protein PilO